MADKKKTGGKLKKLVLLGGFGFVVVVGVTLGSFYFISQGKMGETFEQEVGTLETPEGDDDAIERGEYLVNHVMGCSHSDCHDGDLGGGPVMNAQPMGLIYAPNLTSGEGSVTKDYTGKDWLRILRHGLNKDGTRALIMPSEDYIAFSDEDLGAAVAYIKSVKAVDRESKEHSLGPVSMMLVSTGKLPFAYDKIDHDYKRPEAEPGATKEWGKVLVTTCTGCHGPELSGGKIPGADPSWPEARNITLHESGLKDWEFEDFVTAMREGKRPDGTQLHDSMPYAAYKGMKDDDVEALWLYLQDAKPKEAGGR